MNFLEAHRIATSFRGGTPLAFLLAMSGTAEPLGVFLRAAGAKRERAVTARMLPFNTLGQAVVADPTPAEREVFVLFPWDFVPEADWRSGIPAKAPDPRSLRERAQQTAALLRRRAAARFIYVPAPIPPVFPSPELASELAASLLAIASGLGAEMLSADAFSLANYLSSGNPFSSKSMSLVGDAIVAQAQHVSLEPCKVLVTDLDNVMWKGVIGEDGLDGIQFGADGLGFKHFVYQTFLAKLRGEGALLAAVSRNDAELADAPFASRRMTLGRDDFVAIVASYNAKSAQIKEIARQLNLGLDSFVFVDDNPIEIEEVSSAIPELHAVRFPDGADAMPDFLGRLASLFRRTTVTQEDVERTAMYRRRLEGMVPAEVEGADLTTFLRGLEMSLTIHDRSTGDRTRAVQLINKTNQFNVNGIRVTDDDVAGVLSSGGRLYTCSLADRTGAHGEILSCLIDGEGTIKAFVMSCRVFQRRVEHAFVVWLASVRTPPAGLLFKPTPRNEPAQQFLRDESFATATDGVVSFDAQLFAQRHADALQLFTVSVPNA